MPVEVARIYKLGGALAIHLSKQVLQHFHVNRGDVVGIRVAGEKLIVERIALENVAKLRTGEAEVRTP